MSPIKKLEIVFNALKIEITREIDEHYEAQAFKQPK